MDAIERRVFLKGASMGLLSFTVGSADILMTAGEARARAVPFRLLNAEEAETLEEVHEPFLIQEGYLQRTPQGRMLTPKGYHAVGLKPVIGGNQQSLL